MAPRSVYANLTDGLQPMSLFDQSLADMGNLGMIPCTASGINSVVLTPIPTAFAPTVSIPNQLQSFSFVAVATSTGAITVQIGTASVLNLYKEDGVTQASTGDLVNKVLYGIAYNSALNSNAGGYQIAFPITTVINPVISGATISSSTISGSTITTSTYNGNTWTAGTGILTIAALKTLTASNSLTFTGTDGSTVACGTGGTVAYQGGTLAQFAATTSAQFAGVISDETGTGALVFATSPSLTTPSLGVATATSLNGNTFTTGTYTLTGAAGKTFTFSNSLTLAGTDATTMTFPGTSDTVVTLTATQTLTNKTLTTPNIGAATATSLAFSPTTGGIIGTTAADSAGAGKVGEVIVSNITSGSAVSLSNGVSKTVTSIALTAGDWDVTGNIYFATAGTTTVSVAQGGINTTTNSFPAAPDNTLGFTSWQVASANAITGSTPSLATGVFRQNVSTGTTIFLVASSNFGTSTQAAYGTIWARRIR